VSRDTPRSAVPLFHDQLGWARVGGRPVSVAPDTTARNNRSLFTVPAYDTSGKEWVFAVLADVGAGGFKTDAAGREAEQLPDASPVYAFPIRTGDQQSPGNSRQADMIDKRNGYFSNNPLWIWVLAFLTYTSVAFITADGKKVLADLVKRNGLALDGTPIIKTQSDLDTPVKKGYVSEIKKSLDQSGRYFLSR
jgi:hypothetical protein